MGIMQNSGNNLPAFNLGYSATIGSMYIRTPEVEAKLAAIKAEVGEVEWKKGYQGPKSKAVELARKEKISGIRINGTLTSVRIREAEADGRKTIYLAVGMKDAEGRYYLSVDMASEAAQKLARKLVNCKPGVETEISMFATLDEQKDGQARAYASHGASVKQDGSEVPSLSPAVELKPLVDGAMSALAAAGVDDKETMAKRRSKVTTEYHVKIVNAKAEEFAAFYKQRELPSESDHDASDMPPPLPPEAYANDPFDF